MRRVFDDHELRRNKKQGTTMADIMRGPPQSAERMPPGAPPQRRPQPQPGGGGQQPQPQPQQRERLPELRIRPSSQERGPPPEQPVPEGLRQWMSFVEARVRTVEAENHVLRQELTRLDVRPLQEAVQAQTMRITELSGHAQLADSRLDAEASEAARTDRKTAALFDEVCRLGEQLQASEALAQQRHAASKQAVAELYQAQASGQRVEEMGVALSALRGTLQRVAEQAAHAQQTAEQLRSAGAGAASDAIPALQGQLQSSLQRQHALEAELAAASRAVAEHSQALAELRGAVHKTGLDVGDEQRQLQRVESTLATDAQRSERSLVEFEARMQAVEQHVAASDQAVAGVLTPGMAEVQEMRATVAALQTSVQLLESRVELEAQARDKVQTEHDALLSAAQNGLLALRNDSDQVVAAAVQRAEHAARSLADSLEPRMREAEANARDLREVLARMAASRQPQPQQQAVGGGGDVNASVQYMRLEQQVSEGLRVVEEAAAEAKDAVRPLEEVLRAEVKQRLKNEAKLVARLEAVESLASAPVAAVAPVAAAAADAPAAVAAVDGAAMRALRKEEKVRVRAVQELETRLDDMQTSYLDAVGALQQLVKTQRSEVDASVRQSRADAEELVAQLAASLQALTGQWAVDVREEIVTLDGQFAAALDDMGGTVARLADDVERMGMQTARTEVSRTLDSLVASVASVAVAPAPVAAPAPAPVAAPAPAPVAAPVAAPAPASAPIEEAPASVDDGAWRAETERLASQIETQAVRVDSLDARVQGLRSDVAALTEAVGLVRVDAIGAVEETDARLQQGMEVLQGEVRAERAAGQQLQARVEAMYASLHDEKLAAEKDWATAVDMAQSFLNVSGPVEAPAPSADASSSSFLDQSAGTHALQWAGEVHDDRPPSGSGEEVFGPEP